MNRYEMACMLSDKEKEIKRLREENQILKIENKDLKKEINRLNELYILKQ